MANENMEEWKALPSVVNETVRATRDFLNAELAKYDTWEEAKSNNVIRLSFINAQGFGKAKNELKNDKGGAGQLSILKFLGGNWKQWMVQEGLALLDDEAEKKVDRAAAEIRSRLPWRYTRQFYHTLCWCSFDHQQPCASFLQPRPGW